MKKPTFRPGLRDQQRAVKTHMESLARLHGVTLPDGALSDVKDKIARGPRYWNAFSTPELSPHDYDLYAGRNLAMLAR